MEQEPSTLQEAIVYFSNPANCREFLVARRWPHGIECPRCGSKNILFLEKYNRWQCREGHWSPQFTLKTGTPMEDSPVGLDKWLTAIWQVVNCKNGVSSCEIARAIGVTQKSAWFMDHRIRCMLGLNPTAKASGHVEADETVHTNGMENFWSLLKRGLHGTYVSVEPFHLFRYLDEQVYRFNNRKISDAERFDMAVTGMVGKRLTFDQLTGKTEVQV